MAQTLADSIRDEARKIANQWLEDIAEWADPAERAPIRWTGKVIVDTFGPLYEFEVPGSCSGRLWARQEGTALAIYEPEDVDGAA